MMNGEKQESEVRIQNIRLKPLYSFFTSGSWILDSAFIHHSAFRVHRFSRCSLLQKDCVVLRAQLETCFEIEGYCLLVLFVD